MRNKTRSLGRHPSARSTSTVITNYLRTRRTEGAALQEIYLAVRTELGEVPQASIRSAVYKRLVAANSKYLPRFERFVIEGKTRYRLLSSDEQA